MDDEFTCRSDDERSGSARDARAGIWVSQHSVENGNEIGGRFTGAGLGPTGHIGASDGLIERFGLDRGAVAEASVINGVHDRLGEIEVMKTLLVFGGFDGEFCWIPRNVWDNGRRRLDRFRRLVARSWGAVGGWSVRRRSV